MSALSSVSKDSTSVEIPSETSDLRRLVHVIMRGLFPERLVTTMSMVNCSSRTSRVILLTLFSAYSLSLASFHSVSAAPNEPTDKGTQATSATITSAVGAGGELHQTAGGKIPTLTTEQGTPVSDNQNTLRVGPRGPALLMDQAARAKIFHFDHSMKLLRLCSIKPA